jgi:hypothetical protein
MFVIPILSPAEQIRGPSWQSFKSKHLSTVAAQHAAKRATLELMITVERAQSVPLLDRLEVMSPTSTV